MKRWIALIALGAAAACSGGADSGNAAANTAAAPAASNGSGADLTGAGATFPYPIYSKWFESYAQKTGVKINYQSIGSGGGIRQLSEQTVDFGASDSPMTDAEIAAAKGGDVLHFPTVIGADAIVYNVPGVANALKLDGGVIADIFLGKITKWNDARIAASNAATKLPATDILVVHRSDGSGTTFIFTDYLSAVSPSWKSDPGKGKQVKWPVGVGAKGNEGVAGQVKQIPGAIGYVELAYAKQNNLTTAEVRNAAGAYIAPSTDGATAAAEGFAGSIGADSDFRVSIVNAPGANAYPISSFTWLLVYKNQTNAAKSKKLTDFIRWALSDGQPMTSALDYAPLPANMVKMEMDRLATITGATTAAATTK